MGDVVSAGQPPAAPRGTGPEGTGPDATDRLAIARHSGDLAALALRRTAGLGRVSRIICG
jgi:hypothetical protein